MSLFFLVVLFFCWFFGFLFFGRFGFLVLCIFWFFSPFPFPFAADWHRPTDMQQTNNCFSSKILQICARWWCPVLFIYVCIYLFVIYCISDEFIELALFQTKNAGPGNANRRHRNGVTEGKRAKCTQVWNTCESPVEEHLIRRSVGHVLSDHHRNKWWLVLLHHVLQSLPRTPPCRNAMTSPPSPGSSPKTRPANAASRRNSLEGLFQALWGHSAWCFPAAGNRAGQETLCKTHEEERKDQRLGSYGGACQELHMHMQDPNVAPAGLSNPANRWWRERQRVIRPQDSCS